MMKSKRETDLQQDALFRQRNVAFPDTVNNEFAGYRHLLSSPKLTTCQKVGALIVGVMFFPFGLGMIVSSVFAPRMIAGDSSWVGAAFIPLALVISLAGLALAVLGFKLLRRAIGR